MNAVARGAFALIAAACALSLSSCSKAPPSGKRTIVVTYSVLGSAVKDLVGDAFDVVVSIPDGLDPHDWEPSAKDIETVNKASLVVENGLGLEEGMKNALEQARKSGVRFFTAADHVVVRTVGKGEGIPSGDPDQAIGAEDPHLWTDPVTMQAIVDALADELEADFKVDLSKRRADLDARLVALDAEIAASVAEIPAQDRVLVTGHESMGYFAERYGFRLVGAVVPSLSSQAESSASELAALKRLIAENKVSAIFVELGENPKVAEALAREAEVRSVALTTHALPKGGDYVAFARSLAKTIVEALGRAR
jgi:zinc/manganese transport system substrate-binding protein